MIQGKIQKGGDDEEDVSSC